MCGREADRLIPHCRRKGNIHDPRCPDPGGPLDHRLSVFEELLIAEMTGLVGPTTLRRGVSPAILPLRRDTPDHPNWTADPAVWGELFPVRFGSVWEEVLERLQGRYDLRE